MIESIFLVVMGVLTILLVPIVPRLLEFRIRMLHIMGLGFFARLQKDHFDGLVTVARILLVVVALLIFFLAANT